MITPRALAVIGLTTSSSLTGRSLGLDAPVTRGQTIYFFDPSGNRNEVFAGGFIYYPDNPKRV